MEKIYPESKVELTPFIAKYYDEILDIMSLGIYDRFIHRAIGDCNLKPSDKILDLGAGSGKNAMIMLKYIGRNGKITAIDISKEMEKNFKNRLSGFKNVNFRIMRIDKPFELNENFDVAFISFVIHGFPNEVRKTIIQNVYNALKQGGRFIILDFNEFSLADMPLVYKIPFKTIECKYAFDFIERDWKSILENFGFSDFKEKFYFKNYVRLLEAKKSG